MTGGRRGASAAYAYRLSMTRYLVASDSQSGALLKRWSLSDETDEQIELIKAEYEAPEGRQVSFVVAEGETPQEALFPRRPGA